MSYSVLYVEDDASIALSISKALKLSGYNVTHVSTVREGKKLIEQSSWDVFLLDVNLPDGKGFELCEAAKSYHPYAPVLMLTASIDEESVVRGLSSGAVDYMRKPVGIREIQLRIQNALGDKEVLRFGSLDLKLHQREISVKGNVIHLARREFDLLSVLLKKAGHIVSREEVLERLKSHEDVSDRVVDSHLSRLRRKLSQAGAKDIEIETVYGSGYQIKKAS